MRDTHWNPRFVQLSLDLAGRLLSARASCTSHSVDRWPEAQLANLELPTQNGTSNSTPSSGSHLVTFQLLKHIFVNSVPFESVFQSPTRSPQDSPDVDTWPKVQQYFSKLRSLIFTSPGPTPLPSLASISPALPPTAPALPSVATSTLFSPQPLQPSSALPLMLLTQPSPYLLPSSTIPLLTIPPQLQLTGNLITDLLTITASPPFRLLSAPPLTFSHTPLQQLMLPAPSMMGNQLPVQMHKPCFNHLQVVCFKDEAKTRFMCSVSFVFCRPQRKYFNSHQLRKLENHFCIGWY